jgi:hypothetical protein
MRTVVIWAAGFELRCKVEVPDEQDRLYRQWEATVPPASLEDWYERLEPRQHD